MEGMNPKSATTNRSQDNVGKESSLVKMIEALDKLPWATLFGGLIVAIAAIVGGVVVLVGKSSLDFAEYVDTLSKLAIGVGLVAVGRGIRSAGKNQ